MSTLAIAASGLRSAGRFVAVASHNVANLDTPDFRPLEAVQRGRPEGGSEVEVRQAESPREVDLGRQFVDQALATIQYRASLQVIATEREMQDSLLDIFV